MNEIVYYSFKINYLSKKPLLEFKRKRLQQRKNQILFDFSATKPV